jgi:hypothetical protein
MLLVAYNAVVVIRDRRISSSSKLIFEKYVQK